MHQRRVAILVVLGMAVIWQVARAEAPWLTLLPGTRAEYRLDYRGDGSPVTIAVDVSDPNGVTMSIYTPEQVEALRRGENPSPVGRGTPGRGHSLFWSGAAKAGGIYRVYITNASSAPVLYRIEVTGEGLASVSQVLAATPPPPAAFLNEGGQKTLNVSLPPGSGAPNGNTPVNLRLTVPPEPQNCLHANQISGAIAKTVKLCPNEIYPPLQVSGTNIGVFTDDARTAVVTSSGRQFAITVQGSNNWIEGVTIQARTAPVDLGAWLCLYDECIFPTKPMTTTIRGGIQYGGGILLKGTNSTVHGVTVRGGTIGVATVGGLSNYIIENKLNDLNGWGSININSVGSYYVGNEFHRNNHGCTTPDGRKFLHGCETAGWVCLGCSANVIAKNRCELSANCYYMSGERGLGSNDNKLVANTCSGATDNCFEITFSRGNVLRDNVTIVDNKTDAACKYPFWVGGSIVYFLNNTWECSINENDALAHARDSTPIRTGILPLEALYITPGVASATAVPTVTVKPTRRELGRASVVPGVAFEK